MSDKEIGALDEKAVRQLLADIARLASDYEIGDVIDREDLGAYFEWRNCMDLADAYGRGNEQQYFDEIASAYGLPPTKRPCAPTTAGAINE